MKNLLYILILLIGFSFNSQGQSKPIEDTVTFTFDNDTSFAYRTTYDYRFAVGFKATSLTGSLDGFVYIETKMIGCDWETITNDTTIDVDGSSKYSFDEANRSFNYINDYTRVDSIRFRYDVNSISGGTVFHKFKRYRQAN